MYGSLRELQRALAAVFAAWDSTLDWQASPSPQIRALYDAIDAYTERHTTPDAPAGGANDELRAAHEAYVAGSEDGSREVFFLELLARLLPVLSASQALLWLRTYLRPAVDSAGFDLALVAQARAFVRAVALDGLESLPEPDAVVRRRRHATAVQVMETVAQVYVGGPEAMADVVGVRVLPAEAATQLYAERVRFVQRNAAALLRDWGLQHPQPFFSLLHAIYADPQSRAKVLALAARAASSGVSLVQRMLDTPFFTDVLRLLLLDNSESVLGCCLGFLLMAVGKFCHRVATYVPELLAVYARLLLWKEHSLALSPSDTSAFAWTVAESDSASDSAVAVMLPQVYTDGSFNTLHLATVLYGLFPHHYLKFCSAPHDYWHRNSPIRMPAECAAVVECLTSKAGVRSALAIATKRLLLRLMLHPNLLTQVSLQDELQNPIKWILDKNQGADVGEEDVLIECFALNPDIIFSVPDDLIVSDRMLKKIHSTNSLINEAPELQALGPFTSPLRPATGSGPPSHRGSLQLPKSVSGISSDSKLPSHWLNMDRRVSIVPTKLILEPIIATLPLALPLLLLLHADRDEIRFKSFDFGGSSSIKSDYTAPEDLHTDSKGKDHLSDLFKVHEKLFTSSATATSNQAAVNTDTALGTTKNFQRSLSTASDILSKQLQCDEKSETHSEFKEALVGGNAIDFYQRELLLMKNELEFASYMKHLNKINYVKLKLKFNKMTRDQSMNSHHKKQAHIKDNTSLSLDNLTDSMKNLQVATEQTIAKKSEETKALVLKIQALQNENTELRESNEKSLALLSDEKIAIKRIQATFQEQENKIGELRLQLEANKTARSSLPTAKEIRKEPISSIFLSEQENIKVNLEKDVQILKAQNTNLMKQLEQLAADLEMQKKNVAVELEKKRLRIEEEFRMREIQYERKIKDLSLLQTRYREAIEDKNARIVELTKAKPIRIPALAPQAFSASAAPTLSTGSQLFTGENSGDYFGQYPRQTNDITDSQNLRERSLGSLSHSTTALLPQQGGTYAKNSRVNELPRLQSTSSIPIIRGRGGYQKRSKKFM